MIALPIWLCSAIAVHQGHEVDLGKNTEESLEVIEIDGDHRSHPRQQPPLALSGRYGNQRYSCSSLGNI